MCNLYMCVLHTVYWLSKMQVCVYWYQAEAVHQPFSVCQKVHQQVFIFLFSTNYFIIGAIFNKFTPIQLINTGPQCVGWLVSFLFVFFLLLLLLCLNYTALNTGNLLEPTEREREFIITHNRKFKPQFGEQER